MKKQKSIIQQDEITKTDEINKKIQILTETK